MPRMPCTFGHMQCGILPYAGTDIMLFELLKEQLLLRYDGDPPYHAILGAGMASSSIAQCVSYPLALVRTRLQVRLAALAVELAWEGRGLLWRRGMHCPWRVCGVDSRRLPACCWELSCPSGNLPQVSTPLENSQK